MSLLRDLLLKNKKLRRKFNKFIIREYEQKSGFKQHFHNSRNNLLSSNNLIRDAIESGEPKLIGRFGGTESRLLSHYYLHRMKKNKVPYEQFVLDEGAVLSGIYPAREDIGDYFCKKYIEGLRATDLISVWGVDNEALFIEEFCPRSPTITIDSLMPLELFKPWTMKLAQKRVLIVSPFTETIVRQYANRANIFENPNVLPKFDLIPYKAVQAYGGHNPNYDSYIEVLEKMTADIAKLQFDIAIIGAGAYALPLGKAIKNMGHTAITTCGATQLLFGIKGARWERYGLLDNVLTDYWIKLPESEKPNFNPQALDILQKFEQIFPY